MEKSKDIEEPQNHENDHGSIQDRLNGALIGMKLLTSGRRTPTVLLRLSPPSPLLDEPFVISTDPSL
jgi:hypothetical protein